MLFDRVQSQLTELMGVFGLEDARPLGQVYELICRGSLALPVGRTPPEFSRINNDGTPFQFCLTQANGTVPALQFLSEIGVPGSSMAERLSMTRDRLPMIAEVLGVGAALRCVEGLVDQIAPEGDRELLANASGVFWVGVGFAPGGAAGLKVYVNANWGRPEAQWRRLSGFVRHFGGLDRWRGFEDRLRAQMSPVGMAITLRAGAPPVGRVYLGAYGNPLDYYERLCVDCCDGPVMRETFDRYACSIVGDDRRYPTRSAVWSVAFDGRPEPDCKLELCAHCAFDNDADAVRGCAGWLEGMGADSALYECMVRIVGGARPLGASSPPELHSYVGFGMRGGQPYSTVYLNPGFKRYGANA
jgi:hypothetical protein